MSPSVHFSLSVFFADTAENPNVFPKTSRFDGCRSMASAAQSDTHNKDAERFSAELTKMNTTQQMINNVSWDASILPLKNRTKKSRDKFKCFLQWEVRREGY